MDWGALVREVGAPIVGMILIFILMNKQEQRHREEIKALILAHKDEINSIRKGHEDRLMRLHDRADQLTVIILKRMNENTEAMTKLISLMGNGFKRTVEEAEE